MNELNNQNTNNNEPVRIEPNNQNINTVEPVKTEQNNQNINTVEPVKTEQNNDMFDDINSKGKNKGLIITIVIVILAILGGAAFYFKDSLFSTTNELLSQKSVEYLKNAVNSVNDIIDRTKPLLSSGDISINTNTENLKMFDGYKISYKMGLDTNNNQFLIGLNVNEKEKELLGVDVASKDNKLYLKAPAMFDNIYYLDNELTLLENVEKDASIEDINYLVNILGKAINEALKDDYQTKKDNITIKGKTVKVTDTYYDLDNETYNKILSRGKEVFKNDSKAIGILAKMSGETEENIKKSFEETAEIEENVRLDIYTKGIIKTIVGFKISSGESELVLTFDKDYSNLVLTEEELVITAETVGKITNIKYSDDKNSLTGIITKILDNEYSFDINNTLFNLNGTLKANKEGNKYTESIVANIVFGGINKLTINVNSKLEKIDKLEIFDTSKALDMNEMTEEDAMKMLGALEELSQNSSLGQMLGGLLGDE